MLMDEAAQLGPMPPLIQTATLLRSAGVTLWTFFQSPAQLEATYGGEAMVLVDNAGVVQPQHAMAAWPRLTGGCWGRFAEAVMALGRNRQLLLEGEKLLPRAADPTTCSDTRAARASSIRIRAIPRRRRCWSEGARVDSSGIWGEGFISPQPRVGQAVPQLDKFLKGEEAPLSLNTGMVVYTILPITLLRRDRYYYI